MARVRFHLNRRGVREILNSPLADAAVTGAAKAIASNIKGHKRVSRYRTDRAAASVSVPANAQLRDGRLTKAAARVGLPVRVTS